MMPSIAIIGAGKVGSVLARTWAAHGINIAAVTSREESHAEALAHELGSTALTAFESATLADLTLLAVPDDAIKSVVAELVGVNWTGKAVIHTSGAHNISILQPLAERGSMVGSLHPAYPFASADLPAGVLRSVTFALESNHPHLTEWLYDLVGAAEGQPLTLRPEQKLLYHVALTITSNYAVTLFAASKRLLTELGADGATADSALMALLAGTLDNLRERGVPGALTGPLSRGDIGTIEAHLAALADHPSVLTAYLALAHLTLPLLIERGLNTGSFEEVIEKWEGS